MVTVSAGCRAILDQVDQLKATVVVTKRGRAVARVVPVDAGEAEASLRGSVTLLAQKDEAYDSTGVDWPAGRYEQGSLESRT